MTVSGMIDLVYDHLHSPDRNKEAIAMMMDCPFIPSCKKRKDLDCNYCFDRKEPKKEE